MSDHKGWYSRKRLPHLDGAGVTQFITFRLADSLPQIFLNELAEELSHLKKDVERVKYERIQAQLDIGHGSCILREEQSARIVRDSLQFLHPKQYDLRAFVVMPNHVHALARFEEGQSISKTMHSLKSYTAHEIKKLHPEMDSIWQEESFDRYMRNDDHYWRTIRYIRENPVKARLCEKAEDFQWSCTLGLEDQ